jgi:UDP-glucose 6-dehydrogenase
MANNKIKIGIIGLGMVGEPIRRWFQEVNGYKRGRDLFCYDVDSKKGYSDDVNKADVIFVSVPTPTNPDGSCNVSIVESTVAGISDGKIVVVKSTVTPGTVERLQKKHPKKRLIFNPEFLTESQAWEDYLSPDRQIVGHTAKSISDSVEVLNNILSVPGHLIILRNQLIPLKLNLANTPQMFSVTSKLFMAISWLICVMLSVKLMD